MSWSCVYLIRNSGLVTFDSQFIKSKSSDSMWCFHFNIDLIISIIVNQSDWNFWQPQHENQDQENLKAEQTMNDEGEVIVSIGNHRVGM